MVSPPSPVPRSRRITALQRNGRERTASRGLGLRDLEVIARVVRGKKEPADVLVGRDAASQATFLAEGIELGATSKTLRAFGSAACFDTFVGPTAMILASIAAMIASLPCLACLAAA